MANPMALIRSIPGGEAFVTSMRAVTQLAMLPGAHYSDHDINCPCCNETVTTLAGLHVDTIDPNGDVVFILPDETVQGLMAAYMVHVSQNETCWEATMQAIRELTATD